MSDSLPDAFYDTAAETLGNPQNPTLFFFQNTK